MLVHGFRGDHHGLEPLAKELVARRPELCALVPDLPGFGRSTAIPGRTHDLALYGEWLRTWIDTIVQAPFTLLGHSFGSLVVGSALAQGLVPDRLILINPISAPALKGPKAALTRLTTGYYRVADALPERAARAVLGNQLIVRGMSEVMAKTRDPALRHWIHAEHASHFSDFSDSSTLLEAFRASVSHTVMEFSGTFTMPTLIIAGERDDITQLPQQLVLKRHVPGSQLHIIQGTGHLVHYEAIDEAVDRIVQFLLQETKT